MAEEKAPEAKDTKDEKKGGGSKVVIIMLALMFVVMLGIVGFLVWIFVIQKTNPMAGAAQPPAAAAAHGEEGEEGEAGEEGEEHADSADESEGEDGEDGHEAHDDGHPPVLVTFEPLTANLAVAEGEDPAYIRVTLSIGAKNAASAHLLEEMKVPLRDAALSFFRGLAYADTQGPTKQEIIQRELVTRLNLLFGRKKPIKRIYFTEFVVQR